MPPKRLTPTPGSKWTMDNLDDYNIICKEVRSYEAMFGFRPPCPRDVPAPTPLVKQSMELARIGNEGAVNVFAVHLLDNVGLALNPFNATTHLDSYMRMAGVWTAAKPDVVTQFLADGTVALVMECKRSIPGLSSHKTTFAQWAAEAIACTQFNMDKAGLWNRMMYGVILQGVSPVFVRMAVSDALTSAVDSDHLTPGLLPTHLEYFIPRVKGLTRFQYLTETEVQVDTTPIILKGFAGLARRMREDLP